MKKIAWTFITLGGLLLGIGLWMLFMAYDSTTWPVVKGQIIESKVSGRLSKSSNRNTANTRLEYTIKATYQYQVGATTLQGDQFSFGNGLVIKDGFYDKKAAREWLRNSPYQPGNPVDVYVDPKDANNTVLSAGVNPATWVPLLLSLFFLGLGVALKYHSVIQSRENQKDNHEEAIENHEMIKKDIHF